MKAFVRNNSWKKAVNYGGTRNPAVNKEFSAGYQYQYVGNFENGVEESVTMLKKLIFSYFFF